MSQNRTERTTPYIGVTGFTSADEGLGVFSILPGHSNYLYMVGVLVSPKTLRGEVEHRHPHRYPLRTEVRNIFSDMPMAFNTIHFCPENTDNLLIDLAAIVGLFGGRTGQRNRLHAIQLNAAWPNLRTIELCKRFIFDQQVIHLILQVSNTAMDMAKRNPANLAARIREYAPYVDHFLLDASGSTGQLMDVELMRACLSEIYALDTAVNIGIAGGLSATTLELAAPLFEKFPKLSLNAESQLRDEHDKLSLDKAHEYLRCTERICGITTPP